MSVEWPKRIRVGYADCELLPLAPDDEANDDDGVFDPHRHQIRINMDCTKAEQLMLIVHEMFHGFWKMAALDDFAPEERVVTALAHQMLSAIRDNPALFIRAITVLNANGEGD